jgi:uncharacterized membrane protein
MSQFLPMTMQQRHRNLRLVALFGLSVFYGIAGLLHLARPEPFMAIVPDMLPWPAAIVFVTGICEIAGAVGLHIPRLRRLAGLMLALYALCVWPANLKHALDGIEIGGFPSSWWYHGPRLAAQVLLIWLPLWATGWLPRR